MYPKYYIRMIKDGKTYRKAYTSKKLKLARILGSLKSQIKRFDKAYIRITYSPDYDNQGYYTSFDDLHRAWRAFIEIEEEFK